MCARYRTDMTTVTSSQASPSVKDRRGTSSPLHATRRDHVSPMSSDRSSPWTFWWKFGANFRRACSRSAWSCRCGRAEQSFAAPRLDDRPGEEDDLPRRDEVHRAVRAHLVEVHLRELHEV